LFFSSKTIILKNHATVFDEFADASYTALSISLETKEL
jgi:hypothetical protein